MWKSQKADFSRKKVEKIRQNPLFSRHFVGMTSGKRENVMVLSLKCRSLSPKMRTGMTSPQDLGGKFSTGCGKVCG
jgi:hypothetical protein